MTSVPAIWLCRRLVLDRTLMEALCGGIGEVAQICVLYPLETIKVRTHPAHDIALWGNGRTWQQLDVAALAGLVWVRGGVAVVRPLM